MRAEKSSTGKPWLTTLFAVELLAVALLRIPYDLGFSAFAFADRGSWLTVNALVAQGATPAISFGYPYGLLPVLLSRGWFGLVGASPLACEVAGVLLTLTMAWAFARAVGAARSGTASLALALIALPFAVQSSYPSLAHALEAALLCNALAEQMAGRRAIALALATAAVFAKPSMAYLYGFILVALAAIDLGRVGELGSSVRARRAVMREAGPALLTAGILAPLLALRFGAAALVATVLPLNGMKDYTALNFGFFHGIGRYFWYGMPLRDYLITIVGFWIAASVWLIVAGAAALVRLVREHSDAMRRRDEATLAAALLHLAFVTMFYASPSSWTYYSYVLVMGIVAGTAARIRAASYAAGMLGALALTANATMRINDWHNWQVRRASASTAGLWATAALRTQWQAARDAARGAPAAVLTAQGCAPLLFPDLVPNDGFVYLTPGLARPADQARAMAEFQRVPFVIKMVDDEYGYPLTLIPGIGDWMLGRPLVLKNDFFAVYGPKPR